MDSCSSNVLEACSYLHQGMMTQRSTHAFKGVMVTVNDLTDGECCMNSVNIIIK